MLFSSVETERIERDGDWVEIKAHLTNRDVQRLALKYQELAAVLGAQALNNEVMDGYETPRDLLLRLMIVGWSGSKPVNQETIGKLHPDMAEWIASEIEGRNVTVPFFAAPKRSQKKAKK